MHQAPILTPSSVFRVAAQMAVVPYHHVDIDGFRHPRQRMKELMLPRLQQRLLSHLHQHYQHQSFHHLLILPPLFEP